MDISTREITLKKVQWKQRRFFDHRNYIKKSTWKQRGFSTIKITSKKVRGNDLGFSIGEITSKKYVKMTWKFVGLRRIDVISMSNRRRFDVVCPLGRQSIQLFKRD